MIITNAEFPDMPDWSRDDYLTKKPYEWLYGLSGDRFDMLRARDILRDRAKAIGVTGFLAKWSAYLDSKKDEKRSETGNVTCFENQPIELLCGNYICTDEGISILDRAGFKVCICPHPIEPVRRFIDVDTGEVRIEIAYRRSDEWKTLVTDKAVLACSRQIVSLSRYGVGVDSENASELVKYFSFVESLNYGSFEEKLCVGRLGWIGGGEFSPYSADFRFVGDANCGGMFRSVRECGDYDAWTQAAKEARAGSLAARIMLDSSFASVLVEPCGLSPFFVHLWGGSGAGKTVALMLAASVWADPALGEYIHTLNGTAVGQEMTAGFVNSLPLILDELQTVGGREGFDGMVYKLSEGSGRLRGARNGGIQRTQTWRNCILTSGEQPLTSGNSGAGAVLRVIELDCKSEKLFRDPRATVAAMRENFGFAGKHFVSLLLVPAIMRRAKEIQKAHFSALAAQGAEEKQAAAAAVILAADALASQYIFCDEPLKEAEILPLLASTGQADKSLRAYDWIADFVAVNPQKFRVSDFSNELWGNVVTSEGVTWAYICRNVLEPKMTEAGYSLEAFLSWAKRNGILRYNEGRNTIRKRIAAGHPPMMCVCVKLPETE